MQNHPLGGLDAFMFIRLISHCWKDVKIVANDFLAGFEAESLLIPMIIIKLNNQKWYKKYMNFK